MVGFLEDGRLNQAAKNKDTHPKRTLASAPNPVSPLVASLSTAAHCVSVIHRDSSSVMGGGLGLERGGCR